MENMVLNIKKKVDIDKFFSQVKINTESTVVKVLNTEAKTFIASTEAIGGTLTITGKTVVTALFLNNDGQILSTTGSVDFVQKQKTTQDYANVFVTEKTFVEDVNYSSNEIVCSLGYQMFFEGLVSCELPVENGESDYVTKKSEFACGKLIASPEDTFVVAEEFEVSEKNLEILASSANVLVSETICTVDKLVVNGKVQLEILVKNEELSVYTINKIFEFKQEIQAENAVPNLNAMARCKLKSVTITPEENNEKTMVVCAIEVFAKGYIFEDVGVSVIEDVFSLTKTLDTTYDYIETENFVSLSEITDTFLSQTDISMISDFDDLICVHSPNVQVESIDELEDKYVVSANISASALYKTTVATENLKISAQSRFEIAKTEGLQTHVSAVVPEISSCKVKAGKELEVVYKLTYSIELTKLSEAKVVKKVEEKSEKEFNDSGIRVYIAQSGQSLFDVAKILNVAPETIESQNEFDGGFEQGQKIYVYSPINML